MSETFLSTVCCSNNLAKVCSLNTFIVLLPIDLTIVNISFIFWTPSGLLLSFVSFAASSENLSNPVVALLIDLEDISDNLTIKLVKFLLLSKLLSFFKRSSIALFLGKEPSALGLIFKLTVLNFIWGLFTTNSLNLLS